LEKTPQSEQIKNFSYLPPVSEESFIGSRTEKYSETMTRMTILSGALIALFLITFLGIPVSAYSADATTLYAAGNDRTVSGNYGEAVTAYNNAIALEPSYFEAWNGLADALNRDGKFNDALAASNRSLELHPDYVQGWINRGQILYNIGYRFEDVDHNLPAADALYAEQLAAFEKAIALDPHSAEAWFNKGYALAGMKRYDEAIAAFDQVKVIDPSYPNLQKNREIAVLLRNKAGTPSATPGSVSQSVVSGTPAPLTPAPQPAGTSPRPSPLNGAAGVIALLGAGFLVLQRK
jgi:tetratricopeptide (TPR) repeat protein